MILWVELQKIFISNNLNFIYSFFILQIIFSCGFDENSFNIDLIQRDKFWNLCASFITAIYQKFGGTEPKAKLRKAVTNILETHLKTEFDSFVNLAENLTNVNNYPKVLIFFFFPIKFLIKKKII